MLKRISLFFLFIFIAQGFLFPFVNAETTKSSFVFSKNLAMPDHGQDVSNLQAFLIANKFLDLPEPTGYYGMKTVSAVAEWQVTVGLPDSGYFGPRSREAFKLTQSGGISGNTTTLKTAVVPVEPAVLGASTGFLSSDRDLELGDIGSDVRVLQSFLISTGYLAVDKTTGYFGPQTKLALKKWQLDNNIPTTGNLGPLSRAKAMSIGLAQATFTTTDNNSQTNSQTGTSINGNQVSTSFMQNVVNIGGGGGGSVPSANITLDKLDLVPPTGPQSITGNASDDSSKISLSWLSATDNVAIVGYKVFRNNKQIATTTGTTFIDTSISSSTTYDYKVLAYDPTGNTNLNAVSTKVSTNKGIDKKSPIINIISPLNNANVTSTTTINVSATDNIGITKVEIYIDDVFKGLQAISPYKFPLSSFGITAGLHVVKVKAYDSSNNTSVASINIRMNVPVSYPTPYPTPAYLYPTPAIPTTTTTVYFPSVPTNLIAGNVSTSTISLSWIKSTETNGTVTGYKIYRGSSQVATSTSNAFVDKNLLSNTSYSYAVSAFDSSNKLSAKSAVVTTKTLAIPVSTVPTSLNTNFGISSGSNLVGFSATQRDHILDSLVTLGMGVLRFDMEWKNIQWQNDPNFFDWAKTDALVEAAAARKIKIVAILDYAPGWAAVSGCSGNCPPRDPALYYAFAKKAVERYSGKGVFAWEIWNEPNLASFWGPKASCEAYTELLKGAYTAIKQADPSAIVITGGTAPADSDGNNISPVDFVYCIYKNGGKNFLDAVAHHPYTFPNFPSTPVPHAWAQMSQTSPSIRSIMVDNGDGAKKIWATEFGAPTNGPDSNWFITTAQQTQMVTDAINLYKSYDWEGPLFWYTLKDSGITTDTSENFFGLENFDNTLKPAYKALQQAIIGK